MNGMGSTGCFLLTLVFGLIVFLAQGVVTFLWDFFTSPLLYFFIVVQVIAYFLGCRKKNRNHLG